MPNPENYFYYVYLLLRPDKQDPFDPIKWQPFYAGKGKENRVYYHRKEAEYFLTHPIVEAGNPLKINIIHKLWKTDFDFKEDIVFDNLTEQEAFEIEKQMIAKYGRIDIGTGCLANMTDGGVGGNTIIYTEERKQQISIMMMGENNPFYGEKHTDKTKQEISRKAKDRMQNLENHPMYGKHHTPEAREKISISNKGKPHPNKGVPMKDETKEKLRQVNLGKKLSEDHKRKIGDASRGHKCKEEVKQYLRNLFLGRPLSDETKKKISVSCQGRVPWNKGKPWPEETRKKLSAGQKRRQVRVRWDKLISQYINGIVSMYYT